MFAVGALIAALVAAVAVGSLQDDPHVNREDYYRQPTYECEDPGGHIAAAVWLIIVAVAAIGYHGMMIFVRVLYFTVKLSKLFGAYSLMVSIYVLLFSYIV